MFQSSQTDGEVDSEELGKGSFEDRVLSTPTVSTVPGVAHVLNQGPSEGMAYCLVWVSAGGLREGPRGRGAEALNRSRGRSLCQAAPHPRSLCVHRSVLVLSVSVSVSLRWPSPPPHWSQPHARSLWSRRCCDPLRRWRPGTRIRESAPRGRQHLQPTPG